MVRLYGDDLAHMKQSLEQLAAIGPQDPPPNEMGREVYQLILKAKAEGEKTFLQKALKPIRAEIHARPILYFILTASILGYTLFQSARYFWNETQQQPATPAAAEVQSIFNDSTPPTIPAVEVKSPAGLDYTPATPPTPTAVEVQGLTGVDYTPAPKMSKRREKLLGVTVITSVEVAGAAPNIECFPEGCGIEFIGDSRWVEKGEILEALIEISKDGRTRKETLLVDIRQVGQFSRKY